MNTKTNSEVKTSIPVSLFLETGKEVLKMELAAGALGLENSITEATLNRPGLALSGFFQYFAHRRIQVVGWAEHAYLSSLNEKEREHSLRSFFERNVPCIVVARGKKIFPEISVLAKEFEVPVLKTKMITKHFVNAATIIMENLMAPRMNVQGTMVEIMGIGVLIEGKPGMGKSETALGLIKKGHALVSDDVTALRVDSTGAIVASPVNVTRYHMEIKGLGIVHVPSLFGVASVREEKKLELIVTLCEMKDLNESIVSPGERLERDVLGVSVPCVQIPVALGRDIVNLVETAALDQKLKRLGHDAIKELDENLMALMNEGKNGSE